ncbi:MAG: Sensor protein ZraS [Deltaproteobacteria bacterium ADurb.Bin510]|nr:MAG: Sensor protein ZraS [Deltaproteobacteria bacterium ADurb.Bin510]
MGAIVLAADGQALYANAAARELTGGVPLAELLEGEAQPKELVLRLGGRSVAVRVVSRPLGSGLRLVLVHDIAEIHELQQEILKMDRLASVGELTSGIAHEIRNPLAGIKTTAQALNEELEAGDSRRDYVTRIVREIDRLNRLLLDFFEFARPKSMQPRPSDLRQVVSDAVYLIKDVARKAGVEILEFYPRGKVMLQVDPDMIKQVVMNVVLNGVQTMAGGGRLEVHLDDLPAAACVEVADSGPGIPEHLRARIFDPFFTTKPKGIGLGLSISYRLVKLHGGWIDFETGANGTTFKIFLPRDIKAGREV